MIEAAMLWNEPNNKSHWDPLLDPDWSLFADHVIRAGEAIASVNPGLTRVLGGMSPIDPAWLQRMAGYGALDAVDVVAVHGFPLDWNLWPLDAWPSKIAEIKAVTDKPVWVTEVGVSSFSRPVGARKRGTARRKVHRTTGISTWASSGRTARPSPRSRSMRATRRRSG